MNSRKVLASNLSVSLQAGAALCSLLIACCVTFVPAASAQSIFADLSGTVADASGAVVPGAKVTVKNVSTGTARQVTSNAVGYWVVTQLPTGTYNVTAEASGFVKWTATGVLLQSSDRKDIAISLRVGASTEIVEVNATEGEVAITDTGEKDADISQKELQELSLVGRNAVEFLKVLPGFTMSPNGALNKPGYSGQVVGINGFCSGNGCSAGALGGNKINGQTINISMDGQNTIDPGAAGAATPVNANQDMISEVKVLTSNFTAENATSGPVVVNTVTKSGGNSFHGEGYFYARNSALNANDALYKEPTFKTPKPSESFYYPGGNIGGPLKKNKIFFFEGFEVYRQNLDGGVDRSFIPTQAMLNGDFSFFNTYNYTFNHDPGIYMPLNSTAPQPCTASGSNPCATGWYAMSEGTRPQCVFTNGVMNSACIDPLAQTYLKDVLPSNPKYFVDPSTHNGFNYIQSFSPAPQNAWQNTVRGDVNITDSTKAYVTWSRQRETAFMPTGLWVGASDWSVPTPSPTIGANGSDALTATFLKVFSPTLTSESRFGYTYIQFPNHVSDPKKVFRSDVGYTSKGVFNNPDVPAVLSWGGGVSYMGDVGHDFHPKQEAYKGIPSVTENLTKIIKTHTTKYGFFYQHLYNTQDNWGQYMGVFQYTPIWWGGQSATGNQYADALMGFGAGYFEQALPPAKVNLSQNIAAGYAQDDWKMTRRITVQYGMRFEHYAKPYDATGFGLAVFNPAAYGTGTGTNPGVTWHKLTPSVPLSGSKSRLFYYSPRVGAAIDVFGKGKTVVRGGWGKYRTYDSVQSNNYTGPAGTSLGSVGFGCGSNDPLCPAWEDVDQNAYTPVYGNPVLNGTSFSAVDPHNDEQPLVTSYNLTIDQQLPSKFLFEISYLGNHTDFMQSNVNLDNIPYGAMFGADTNPATSGVCGNGGLTSTTCQNLFRKYPAYNGVTQSITAGKAQYDGLAASLKRNVGWLTLQTSYTFSKALGDNPVNGGMVAALKDLGVHWLYGELPADRRHAFSAAYVIHVPKFIHGGNGCEDIAHCSSLAAGMFNGWEISGITSVQSGAQLFSQNGNQLAASGSGVQGIQFYGTPDIPAYPLITCNPTKGLHHGQYLNGNCFTLPAAGQLGTASMPYLPGPLFWNTDLSITRNIKVREGQNLQFRFSTFNTLNIGLPSFNSNDSNLKLNFNAAGQVTNLTDTKNACPGPNCQALGFADYHFGHRVLELSVKYSF